MHVSFILKFLMTTKKQHNISDLMSDILSSQKMWSKIPRQNNRYTINDKKLYSICSEIKSMKLCTLQLSNQIFTRVQTFPLQFAPSYFSSHNIGPHVLLLLFSCMLLEDAETER